MRLFQSSLSAKAVMAVTGLLLAGFLCVHLGGNLLIFSGPDAFNSYAASLRSLGGGGALWVARLGLLGVTGVHVGLAIRLTRRNRAARPIGYAFTAKPNSSLASRSMLVTGSLILVFVVGHLAHHTFGLIDTRYPSWHDSLGRHDAYRMTVDSFQSPVSVLLYAVAMGVVALHLVHGLTSALRSLGSPRPRSQRAGKAVALACVLLLVSGYLASPLASWSGGLSALGD